MTLKNDSAATGARKKPTDRRSRPVSRRKPYKHKGATIARLATGRFQIRIKDAAGKPYRPSFQMLDEAKAALDQFAGRQARGERFLVTAAHTILDQAHELRVQKLIHDGAAAGSVKSSRDLYRAHWKAFGSRPLSWFVDDRMQAVKDSFTEKKDAGYASATLNAVRKELKRAFDAAIAEGKLAPPNPVSAFGVSVPYVETTRREPLTLADMTALVRVAWNRSSNERQLVAHTRFAMTMVGLSVPLRDQDLCGLCWDCVDLEGRLFYLHRKVAEVDAPRGLRRGQPTQRWALMEGTKTGEKGKGECHMSPVAHAVLCWYRDLLRTCEFPTSGRVPVFRTEEAEMLTTDTVGQGMRVLMCKAGLADATGVGRYTWYNLRHTVPSMWRAVGMDLDDVKDRMRHLRLETTEIYRHRRPEYVQILRPQVEAVIEQLGLQRTADGYIDALGVVLAQMWRQAEIDIPCSPPTTTLQLKRLPNYAADEAHNGTFIEARPNSVTFEVPPALPEDQLLLSPHQMAELRRARARRLFAPPYNWTKSRIASSLGISTSAVNKYVTPEPDEVRNTRRLSMTMRAELQGQIAEMLDAGRNAKQIAEALNVKRQMVAGFARLRGTPVKPFKSAHKMGRFEDQVREWNAAGVSNYTIAKRLGVGTTTVDQFIKKRGLTAAGRHGRTEIGGSKTRKATARLGFGDLTAAELSIWRDAFLAADEETRTPLAQSGTSEPGLSP